MKTMEQERKMRMDDLQNFKKEREQYTDELKVQQQKEKKQLHKVLNWEKQAMLDHKQDLYTMIKEEEGVILKKIQENREKLSTLYKNDTSLSPPM